MIIIEASKNKKDVKTIPGSETTVEVEVPVVFADTKHSRARQGGRELSSEQAIAFVKAALPNVLDAVTKKQITKTQNGDPWFTVVDKQKRGPNGTLRGIDRRRKAAERRLNKIVKEEIKRYYESI